MPSLNKTQSYLQNVRDPKVKMLLPTVGQYNQMGPSLKRKYQRAISDYRNPHRGSRQAEGFKRLVDLQDSGQSIGINSGSGSRQANAIKRYQEGYNVAQNIKTRGRWLEQYAKAGRDGEGFSRSERNAFKRWLQRGNPLRLLQDVQQLQKEGKLDKLKVPTDDFQRRATEYEIYQSTTSGYIWLIDPEYGGNTPAPETRVFGDEGYMRDMAEARHALEVLAGSKIYQGGNPFD